MKKIYFSVFTIFTTLFMNAQQTIGFEGVILAPESFNYGSSGSGGFIENGVVFSNDYNSSWDSWNGFAISNTTDVTTPGYLNQYSSFAGSGSGSSNYAVYYPAGTISFAGQGVDLDSLEITNTTFTAISMRDGDTYSKKFGSLTDANGITDGTNGEDYYKVWIFAHAENGRKIDSVEFYLADFRFTDDAQDYIVNTWHSIDLSFITETVYSISFLLESSDNGDFGMNTPAYFAIDNLTINKSTGLSENTMSGITVYPNPLVDQLLVKGESGIIEIYDVAGKSVLTSNYSGYTTIEVSDLSSGSYTLKITNEKGFFIQNIIK
jgi:hypothetical protein